MPSTQSQTVEELRQAMANGPGEAAQACANVVMRLRGCDNAGAAMVVGRDRELGPLLAAGDAQAAADRLEFLAGAAQCLRCGTCCRTSSPTLYQEDLELFVSGQMRREQAYALRPGEMVYSHRLHRAKPLEQELTKLREAPRGGCVLLSKDGCGAYEARPLQCRWLECWSGRHAGQLAKRPRLTRADLFATDDTALALIREFDQKLPAAELHQALAKAADGDAAAGEKALGIMERDHALRQAVGQRYGYSEQDMELMFGRSALAVAADYGLKVDLDAKGRPGLVRR